jgi:hypothetical protein
MMLQPTTFHIPSDAQETKIWGIDCHKFYIIN